VWYGLPGLPGEDTVVGSWSGFVRVDPHRVGGSDSVARTTGGWLIVLRTYSPVRTRWPPFRSRSAVWAPQRSRIRPCRHRYTTTPRRSGGPDDRGSVWFVAGLSGNPRHAVLPPPLRADVWGGWASLARSGNCTLKCLATDWAGTGGSGRDRTSRPSAIDSGPTGTLGTALESHSTAGLLLHSPRHGRRHLFDGWWELLATGTSAGFHVKHSHRKA
jgi:hypothetical protein